MTYQPYKTYVPARQLLLASSIGLISLICLIGGAKTASASTLILPPNNLSLVGYWPLNEGTGTSAQDKSGSGNTGTLTGGPTWADGKFGRSVSFDDIDDAILVTSSNMLGTSVPNGYAVTAWVYPQSVGDVFERGFDEPAIVWTSSNGGSFQCQTKNGAGTQFTVNAGTSLTNQWYHVACLMDMSDGNLKVYVNGVLRRSTAVTDGGTLRSSTAYGIGSRASLATSYFGGLIDDFRIYSRGLGAAEISRMYQQGSAKRASVNTTGLVGYWRFNEGAGTVAADIGSGRNNGALTGGPTWTTGKFSSGISFDGTDDYVVIGDQTALKVSSSYTLAGWIKPSSLEDLDVVVAKFGSGTLGSYAMAANSTGGLTCVIRSTSGYSESAAGSGITLNNWSHVACVFDDAANTMTLYLNGSSLGVGTGITHTPNTARTDSVNIGHNDGANLLGYDNSYFNGSIDDVRIYNRALGATEIASLYADTSASRITKINTSPVNSMTNGLVGYWTFDGPDLNTTTSTDRSASGNNGTLSGGPVPVSGKIGQALSFDGTNDYVTMGDPASLELSSSYVLAAWVKPTSMANMEPVITKFGANSGPYAMNLANGGGLNCKIEGGPAASSATNGAGISANVWTHVACVFDNAANFVYFYKNGVQLGASAFDYAPDTNGTNSFMIGHSDGAQQNGFPNYFHGAIDDARVYNRALSAAEMLQLYNMGK